jgi:hypothetical protein
VGEGNEVRVRTWGWGGVLAGGGGGGGPGVLAKDPEVCFFV